MKSPSLLIADDEERLRKALEAHFRARGWTVFDTGTVGDVVEILTGKQPSYAIIEPNLPGSLWFRVLQTMRQATPPLTWLALTAYYSSALHQCATEAGARFTLRKPMTPEEIYWALTSVGPANHVAGDEAQAPAKMSLHLAQWEYVNRVLARCAGNVREASRRLGISRQTLYRQLRTYPPTR